MNEQVDTVSVAVAERDEMAVAAMTQRVAVLGRGQAAQLVGDAER